MHGNNPRRNDSPKQPDTHNLVLTLRAEDDDYVVIRDATTQALIGRVRVTEINKDRCRVMFSFSDAYRVDRRQIDEKRQAKIAEQTR